jgi:hypothetical protein
VLIDFFNDNRDRIIAGWRIRPYTLYWYKDDLLIGGGPTLTSIVSA